MQTTLILYPMFTLVLWTLTMALVMNRRASRAVREGLNPEYFRFGRGFRAPSYMISAYQHYNNLFEMPVLFYTVAITIYVTAVNSLLLVSLAWIYVALRLLHSLYHLSNKNIPRRRDTFIGSYVILVLLWSITALSVTGLIQME